MDLFRSDLPESKLHPIFKVVRSAAKYEPHRMMMNEVFRTYIDNDGNFAEQFQTTGFDQRCFELCLHAYLSDADFNLDESYSTPDFICERDGLHFSIEVTTANATQVDGRTPIPKDMLEASKDHESEDSMDMVAIKLGSALYSKLKKEYWKLPQCSQRPSVIAVQAFYDNWALTHSDYPLVRYLYGLHDDHEFINEELKVSWDSISSHKYGPKEIPSSFFQLKVPSTSAQFCSRTHQRFRSLEGWDIKPGIIEAT